MKKQIKKYIIMAALPFILGGGALCLVLLVMSGGDVDKPISTPASEEQASAYYAVSNEIGVPWDLIILVDTYIASKEGRTGIEDCNPLLTSLDFCRLQIKYYEREHSGDDWEYESTGYIKGKTALSLGLGFDDSVTMEELWDAIDKYEDDYKTSKDKRECYIEVVPETEFKAIIETYYGHIFTSKEIEDIITLYESKYLYYLYLDENEIAWIDWDGSGMTLPDVVVGDVSRLELVQIAMSIYNAPYLFGGKSPYPGPPKCALDCSGFIDWVFMQAFGESVSGNLGGVAVQMSRCTPIEESELQIGDLGFYFMPNAVPEGWDNHIGIYVGKINGKDAFIHCGGPYWGYEGRDSGRVVVSINDQESGFTENQTSPLGGTLPGPEVLPSNFVIFGRPQFEFSDELEEDIE